MEDLVYDRRIRWILAFFSLALLISGITAIPLAWELQILHQFASALSLYSWWPGMMGWIEWVTTGVQATASEYPFMAYGTDWLAFGHIAIAVAFVGAIKDPRKNLWVIEFGMIACILVIPWSLIFGALRGIPIFWRLIDCSFGVFGFLPLWLCRRWLVRQ